MQRKTTKRNSITTAPYFSRITALAAGFVLFVLWSASVYAVSAEFMWKAKTGAAISDAPLAINGFIYAASADKHLYCWDAVSGEELWKTRFKQRLYYSPVYSDGGILVVEPFSTGKIYAVDSTTGDKKWSTKIGKRILKPVVSAGSIIVASGKRLVVLRSDDGTVIDQYVTKDNITSVLAWNDYLAVVTVKGDLEIFDLGLEPVAEIPLGPGGVFLYPSEGDLYGTVTTGATFKIAPDFEIAWRDEYGFPAFRSPIKSGDYVYTIIEGGLVLAHSVETGELIGEVEVPYNVFSYSRFSSGVVLVSELGTMYYVYSGTLNAIETEGMDSDFYAPISVSGDSVYFVNSIGFLYGYRVLF